MCSFSYIFSVLISTKRNCWRSINSFAGSISFSNDSSEDDARTTTAWFRAKAFTLGLLLPLAVVALRRSEKIRLQMFDYDVIEALSREQRESLYSQKEQSSRKRERMVLRLLKTSFSSSSSSLRCCCCCSPL